MQIEKIAVLLGQCEQVIGVIDAMPEEHRLYFRAMLCESGLVPEVLSRNLVRVKNNLLNLNEDGFESFAAISTAHIDRDTLLRIEHQPQSQTACGMVFYPNEYGGFVVINADSKPATLAPKCLQEIYSWALRREIKWVKLDADAVIVDGLPVYETEPQAV